MFLLPSEHVNTQNYQSFSSNIVLPPVTNKNKLSQCICFIGSDNRHTGIVQCLAGLLSHDQYFSMFTTEMIASMIARWEYFTLVVVVVVVVVAGIAPSIMIQSKRFFFCHIYGWNLFTCNYLIQQYFWLHDWSFETVQFHFQASQKCGTLLWSWLVLLQWCLV